MLIDTGYPVDDRDVKRIYAAAQLAGLKKIDDLVISHFHRDHLGGPALVKMIPVGRLFDHGDAIEKENQEWLDSYHAASAGKRTIVKAGDEIPLKGVQVVVVSSDQHVIAKAVNGGGRPNPLCENAEEKAPVTPENQRTIGLLLTYRKFKFLNLIDLDWEKDMELACPINKLGTVTVYQTSRHGSFDGAASPPFLGAIMPQVIVVNNGPRKGLGQVDPPKSLTPPGQQRAPYEHNSYLRMAKIPGIEGIWQGHLSLLDKDPKHNTSQDMIANVEETAECKGTGSRRRSGRTASSPSRTAATGSAKPTRPADRGPSRSQASCLRDEITEDGKSARRSRFRSSAVGHREVD